MANDVDNRTLIAMAASSGNKYVFNAVLTVAYDMLSESEVQQPSCLT